MRPTYYAEWIDGSRNCSIGANRLDPIRAIARRLNCWLVVYRDDLAIGEFDPRGNWFEL